MDNIRKKLHNVAPTDNGIDEEAEEVNQEAEASVTVSRSASVHSVVSINTMKKRRKGRLWFFVKTKQYVARPDLASLIDHIVAGSETVCWCVSLYDCYMYSSMCIGMHYLHYWHY